MPAFFSQQRGTVVRVGNPANVPGGPTPFRIIVPELDGITGFDASAIVTQGGIMERGGFQFTHTLAETIYAFIFGDRIGELRIGGICFANFCNGKQSGMQQVLKAYHAHKLSVRGRSLPVDFGGIIYKGFLTGCNLEVADPERNLGQWMMQFNTFPGKVQ